MRPGRRSSRGAQSLVGRSLGNYCVGEIVGKGGMATVYRAEHRILGRSVALKVLHRHHLENTTMTRRFVREARVLAGIQHPGIVSIHDIGRTTEGHLYTVMELLEGQSLLKRLKAGPMSERRTLAIARQIASALAAAHDRGIVHRDIKPGNVHLVADPEAQGGERVKVLDFGIAKPTGLARHDITSAGIAVGTPAYMAPEQCLRDRAVDARTDIYSLGALMYQMVTGRPPFCATDELEVLRSHLHEVPVHPGQRGALISPELEHVIMTCLRKQPARRFQSMTELAEKLAELETHAMVTEITGPMPEQAIPPAAPAPVQFADSRPLDQLIPVADDPAWPDPSDTVPMRRHRLMWSALGGIALAGAVIAISTLLGYA